MRGEGWSVICTLRCHGEPWKVTNLSIYANSGVRPESTCISGLEAQVRSLRVTSHLLMHPSKRRIFTMSGRFLLSWLCQQIHGELVRGAVYACQDHAVGLMI